MPFDMAAAQTMADWRNTLAWPLGLAPLQTALLGRQRVLLAMIGAWPDDTARRVALLAAGRCLSSVSALIEVALLVQAEDATGLRLAGGPPELEWLRGAGTTPPATPQRQGQPDGARNAMTLRRVARTASWTPWWRLVATLLMPEAVAVTHNAMLREVAARGFQRVAFRHGDALFHGARAPVRSAPEDLVAAVTQALCDEPALTDAMRLRLRALAQPKLTEYLDQAATDLAAMASVHRLPKTLWSGSGGNYMARAIGLEVMRRGGQVLRFDHGGSTGMIATPDPLTLRETSVSTEFVVASDAVAALCRAQDAAQPVRGLRQAAILAGAGEPHLRSAVALPPRASGARPKVVYATGALYGFRQLIPPVLRDPVYLDWQLRVAETLNSLPIMLLLKPHPEGIFRGKRHPLADVGPSTTARFETVMADHDVFVFDFALSTAFWTAVCSDRPIVFLDLGLAPFDPTIRAALERRCRIVPAQWGTDNIPRVTRESLGQAISDAARTRPDPAEFRRLLAGG
ncbi:MAG: hypothetical protein NTY59_00380 [Alphaproteobacteria bacterium]|nr:hypothetical protein [Alphaproteobacteria bacterium]